MQQMTRTEIENHIWNICMRIGGINGEIYNIKIGEQKSPLSLPPKLIILINQNFNNLHEVNQFFAPINKVKNFKMFKEMINNISPFKTNEILFDDSMFIVERKEIYVTSTEYRD